MFDSIRFGEIDSERPHAFSGENMERIEGALGVSARRILQPQTESYYGGNLYFTVRVNPRKLNYLTVKYWGGEANPNLLVLSVDGRQLGYRYLGEIDILDTGSVEPPAPGRFYYVTMPIPVSATYGKDKIVIDIRATGPVRRSGRGFLNYQEMMTQPSRAVYACYIHDEGFFQPPAKDVQGELPAPVAPAPRSGFPEELLNGKVNEELERLLAPPSPLVPESVRAGNQLEMRLLAHAFFVPGSEAFRSPRSVRSIVAGVDNCFIRFRKDPLLAGADRSARFPEYTGFGPAAEAVVLLWKEIAPELDKNIQDEKGDSVSRRRAWAELFEAGVKHLAASRSFYPTPAMVGDANLHWCNRALKLLDSSRGLPLDRTLGFLHEAAGVKPWSGALDSEGNPSWTANENYRLFTARGLARLPDPEGGSSEESGYLYNLYDATRPAFGEKGDSAILEAMRKCFRARSHFRYPARDAAGRPAIRQESATNWYLPQLPGMVAYGELWSDDGTPLQTACETRDPLALRAAFQAIESGDFSVSLSAELKRAVAGNMVRMLRVRSDYSELLKMVADMRSGELPMAEKKNFVFSDEENGLLALKDGDDVLFGAFYWRARYGINFLARFHHITPRLERIATVRQEIEYEQSRLFFNRPNWVNWGFGNGGIGYPGRSLSLHDGETLPLAKFPMDSDFAPGQEHPEAGRGDYYSCAFGSYLFGMNATPDKEFELKVPAGKNNYRIFPEGEVVKAGTVLSVKPLTTIVLKVMQ